MSMHHKAPCLNPLWQSGRKTVISHPLCKKNLEWYSYIYIRVHFCPVLVHWPLLPWKAKDLPGGILYLNNHWVNGMSHANWWMRFVMQKLQASPLHKITCISVKSRKKFSRKDCLSCGLKLHLLEITRS